MNSSIASSALNHRAEDRLSQSSSRRVAAVLPNLTIAPSTLKKLEDALQFLSANTLNHQASSVAATHLLAAIDAFDKSRACPDFELFPKLPLELRLKIWQHAARFSQIIGVKDDDNDDHAALAGSMARCSLLLINTEARDEVIKTKINYNAACGSDAPMTWINLEVDIL